MLLAGQETDDQFPGLEYFVRQLAAVSSDISIWMYADSVLKQDEALAAKIFMKQGMDVNSDESSDYIDKTLNLLNKYVKARRLFLEFLVLERGSSREKHHTQLAMAYLDLLKHSESSEEEVLETSEKFRKLILTSSLIQARFLLQHLDSTSLHYEKAILYGKLGEHDKALNILVKKVRDPEAAEKYCDEISVDTAEMRQKMLFLLLQIYLHPDDSDEHRDKYNVLAIDLLNTRAKDMNGTQILKVGLTINIRYAFQK